jgi:hypothetical protein
MRGIEMDHDDKRSPVFEGMAPKNALRASSPPADAPMPTRGDRCRLHGTRGDGVGRDAAGRFA